MIIKKEDLIQTVAQKANLTKASSKEAVDAFLDAITEALQAGDKVQLHKFGSFEVKVRPAHQAWDPANKKHVDVPDRKGLKFKASSALNTKL